MTDSTFWRDRVMDQLTWHWTNHLRPRFDGLGDEEYHFEPVPGCWGVRRREDPAPDSAEARVGSGDWLIDYAIRAPEPAPVTTIAWRLGHVIVGVFAMRNASHFGRESVDYDSHPYAGTATEALEQLDAEYDTWVAGAGSWDDDRLREPIGPAEGPFAEAPSVDLLLHIHRELIHHGAEIALLRDLWANGARSAPSDR